nr:MAG TPA: antirepressor protein [Caudoviricetes sp.]
MELSLLEFARGIGSIGPFKVIRLLAREGYLKRREGINVPTEKAEGLLGLRRAITRGGKRPNYHWQTYVTSEGEKFFADMIEAELKDFGHWELKR